MIAPSTTQLFTPSKKNKLHNNKQRTTHPVSCSIQNNELDNLRSVRASVMLRVCRRLHKKAGILAANVARAPAPDWLTTEGVPARL